MLRSLFCIGLLLGVFFTAGLARADDEPPASPGQEDPRVRAPAEQAATKTRVMIIPVREAIDEPVLFILRRGLKQAIEQKIEVVVLDMNTPGGRLDVTFDILEALEKFPGRTATFVNKDAISAGAFISAATHEIHFAPTGVIGAAAPVSGTGQEIDKSMQQKIVSYLKARVRSISEGKGYRGEVISAMIDASMEFKIGERVIKKKDELLSLTATEAAEQFGEPPQPLLAAGIAKDIDELLAKKFGADGFIAQRLEITWSEKLAQYLNNIKPMLLGLGLLAIFIEMKTPGFGVFGVAGAVLLGIVFLSSYVAGLSGHEPVLLFALGVALVAMEIFFLPGTMVFALSGVVLMLGSLVWAMADLWPNEPISITWSGDVLVQPLLNLGLGFALAVVLGAALVRFLPKGWIWNRMVLASAVGGSTQNAGVAGEHESSLASLIGQTGTAVTPLRPSGQVEIAGRRYEARLTLGAAERGERVVVIGRADFSLTVEKSPDSAVPASAAMPPSAKA